GSTILMGPPHESSIHVGLPVQMMPPGAQLIQVQQHPHGQPLQVVQRIPGQMFHNSQIVHQMPYGHVIRTAQPGQTIQLQHHPADLKDLNAQAFAQGGGLHLLTNANSVPTHHHLVGTTSVTTGVPLTTATFAHTVEGPSLIKFHDDSHRQISSSGHFDEHHHHHHQQQQQHHHHLSSTDESLVRLSTSSSTHFQPQLTTLQPSLLGAPSSPRSIHHHHQQQLENNVIQGGRPPPSLLQIPVNNDEQQQQPSFPRRISRFEERESVPQSHDNNASYPSFRGGRPNYNDRMTSNTMSRGFSRGRGDNGGGGRGGGRGYNNNDRSFRSDSNDNNPGGFRSRGGYNRGGRGAGGEFRFHGRGNNRVNHEHSPTRRSSRSPDRRSSSSRKDQHSDKYSSITGFSAPPNDDYSHRSLPSEALRKKDKSNSELSSNDSNNKSSLTIDETIGSRSGHID
ncbi:unnamed protein product, partial [Adineta steineri]